MRVRQIYKWGAKHYLASMEVGELLKEDGTYSWAGLRQTASRLKAEFGSEWKFFTTPEGRYIKRIQ